MIFYTPQVYLYGKSFKKYFLIALVNYPWLMFQVLFKKTNWTYLIASVIVGCQAEKMTPYKPPVDTYLWNDQTTLSLLDLPRDSFMLTYKKPGAIMVTWYDPVADLTTFCTHPVHKNRILPSFLSLVFELMNHKEKKSVLLKTCHRFYCSWRILHWRRQCKVILKTFSDKIITNN